VSGAETKTLEEEREFLLRSLDDLDREHGAGDLDDHDYEVLRDGYTARAAAVLRAIDAQHAARPPKGRRNWRRMLAWAGGVIALAVLAGVLVAWASGQRLPGDSSSGDIAQSVTAELAEARSLQETDPKGAIQRYDAVLKVEPDNSEALTYEGWLLILVGNSAKAGDLVSKGSDLLDHAIRVAPGYADPYCFKAIVRFRDANDPKTAKPAVDRCLALNPPADVVGLVQGMQGEINAALAKAASTTTTG
jgi:hypothetical protein